MTTSARAENVPSPGPRAPIWEDFADIFVSPSAVFDRRRDGKFGLVLLIISIIMAALTWVWFDAMEPAMARQMAAAFDQIRQQNPNITEEQLAQGRAFGAVFAKFGAIIMIPIVVLLTGVVTWLIGKFFDSVATLGTALMIATYAQFPRLLKTLVETAQAMFMDPAQLDSIYRPTLSPARFMDPDSVSQTMLAIASRFDVFVIWMTVLIGIGMHVAGRLTKRNATIVAILVWLLASCATIASVARQGG